MTDLKYAMITPSYEPDFARCQLLCQSIEKFVSPQVKHYLLIDDQDVQLFRELENSHTEIIRSEDLIPWWIKRTPLSKRLWFSFKSLPIRGWILQQILKLSIANYISEDVLVFVDSDTTFIRPFPLSSFEKSGKTRLFRIANGARLPSHHAWHRSSGSLLGLPIKDYYEANYVGNLITWKRENVLRLQNHLEKISGKSWIQSICQHWKFSEYILYGIFVDCILKEQSDHYYSDEEFCHEYWIDKGMTNEEVNSFISAIGEHHAAIMIYSKADICKQRHHSIVRKAEEFMKIHFPHLGKGD